MKLNRLAMILKKVEDSKRFKMSLIEGHCLKYSKFNRIKNKSILLRLIGTHCYDSDRFRPRKREPLREVLSLSNESNQLQFQSLKPIELPEFSDQTS